VVYASEVADKKLTFQVSGKLWNRSLVMRDLETGSLWSHILGECMAGELKGEKLEVIPAVMTTWEKWLTDHPQTSVLDMAPTAARFRKDFYKDLREFVYGVKVGTVAKAYSFAFLESKPLVQEELGGVPVIVSYDAASTSAVIFGAGDLRFKAVLEGGRMIEVKSGSGFNPLSGHCSMGELAGRQLERLSGIVSYRRAWLVFYPESAVADPK
jgi:hypothetical protein